MALPSQTHRRSCADDISVLAHCRRKNTTTDSYMTDFAGHPYMRQPEQQDQDFERALEFAARVELGLEDHQITRLFILQRRLRQSMHRSFFIDGFV